MCTEEKQEKELDIGTELLLVRAELDSVTAKTDAKKRFALAIALLVIGFLSSLINALADGVCFLKINGCALCVFDIINLVLILVLFILQIVDLFRGARLLNRKKTDATKNDDDMAPQKMLSFYKTWLKNERERSRRLSIVCFSVLLIIFAIEVALGIFLFLL